MAINNRDLLVFVGFTLLFLLINFNRDLGTIYLGMVMVHWAIFSSDKIKTYVFQRKDSHFLTSLLKAVIIYAGFVLFSGLFLSLFHSGDVVQGQIIMSVMKVMAQTTPALANSLILTFFAWAISVWVGRWFSPIEAPLMEWYVGFPIVVALTLVVVLAAFFLWRRYRRPIIPPIVIVSLGLASGWIFIPLCPVL